jgi:hypothetical protein
VSGGEEGFKIAFLMILDDFDGILSQFVQVLVERGNLQFDSLSLSDGKHQILDLDDL